MDVTSLLNSNPAAAEQRKRADSSSSRVSSRSRTPWDAGGYSLPINTAAQGIKAPQQPENRHDDPPVSTPPCSPKHRFSDSRSSLSSFASSLLSTTTHSRYSSTSTLNSNTHAHHKSFGTDILSPELRSISQALEESASLPIAIDSFQPNESQQDMSLSPTGSSLEQLALVAGLSKHQSESSRRRDNDEMETTATDLAAESDAKRTFNRPGSPSDAILIKRTSIPRLRVNTGDLSSPQQQINYLSAPLDRYRPSLLQNNNHKRTLSEPNFRQTTTSSLVFSQPHPHLNTFFAPSYDQQIHPSAEYHLTMEKSAGPPERGPNDASPSLRKVNSNIALSSNLSLSIDTSTSTAKVNANHLMSTADSTSASTTTTMNVHNHGLGPQAEPTPPSSSHPDHASPTNLSQAYPNPNTPPTLAPLAVTQTIVCMYVPNCDTGSQLRKAISHIFGRNKMCTRLIPDEVWVHYCRKHYQRARYRNPKEYAKCQCDLVQEQLDRIHAWSENNRVNRQNSGVVQDWTLAIRKRELKRQEEKERKANKRKRGDIEADNDDEEDDDVGHEPATAVPTWLREHCHGQKYTTEQIRGVFNRLHREILADTGSASFPDLEILPNISTSNEEPKSPKGYTKRTSSASHRRSQSMGVVPSSQHSTWGREPSIHDAPVRQSPIHDFPTQKRRRPNSCGDEEPTELDYTLAHLSRSRPRRPEVRLPHRQMYPHPEEHYGGQPHGGYYGHSPFPYDAPLPAPHPQRSMGYSTASYLERGPELRRQMHTRSQSDVGFMHGQPGHMAPVQGYYSDMRGPAHSPYHQGMGHAPSREHTYSPPAPRQQHLSDMRAPYPQHGYAPTHSRHQSTPMMQSAQAYGSQPGQGYVPPQTGYAALPPRHSPLPPTPHVTEDEKTQQLFRDRR